MKEHECKYQYVIEDMRNDISEIKGDVKSLLKFKWQIIGGAGILGVLGAGVTFMLSILGFTKL